MGKEDMFLFWGSGSSPCMRVMIALEEKGFSGYPQKCVDFGKGEHKGEDILALNPRGQVPTFKDGDCVLNESYAVIHYLQARYPDSGTNLIPGDAKQQALVLQRYYEVTGNLSPAYYTMFVGFTYRKVPEDQQKQRVEAFLKELAIFEGYIEKTGAFLAGDSFTLADIDLITNLTMCERQGLDMEGKCPNLFKYYQRVKERPSVVASYPPHFLTSDSPKILANF